MRGGHMRRTNDWPGLLKSLLNLLGFLVRSGGGITEIGRWTWLAQDVVPLGEPDDGEDPSLCGAGFRQLCLYRAANIRNGTRSVND